MFQNGRDDQKPPIFYSRLTDQTASQGSTVRFTCATPSHSEINIQWLKDGIPILLKRTSDSVPSRYRSKQEGGISSLEISNVTHHDSGEYECLAKNLHGKVSTKATLKVFEGYKPAPFPPIFTKPIKENYLTLNEELKMECRVRSQPPAIVTWLKNGTPIKADSKYRMSEKADGLCTLTICHPNYDDNGEYTCKAENAVASAQNSHFFNFSERQKYGEELTVDRRTESRRLLDYDLPRFHSGLTNNRVPIGGTIALQVELKGTPREVKWLRGHEELPRASSRIKSFEDSGVYTLLVSEASEKESGVYTCRAYSNHGHIDSSANIQIVPHGLMRGGKPPKIINKPVNMLTVTVEDDVVLTCRVKGEPRPRVTWLKGVKDITITERTMMEHSDDYYKFTLKKVVPADAGTYWIVAKNANGSDRAFVTVQVLQNSCKTPRGKLVSPIKRYYSLQITQRARSLTPGPFSSSRWNWGFTKGSSDSLQDLRFQDFYRSKGNKYFLF